MTVTLEMIKELRVRTGVGILDCKKALEAANGNMEEAIHWLRKHGIAKAQAKQARINVEGLIRVLVQDNKAIILELNCETDFVAKNEVFNSLLDKLLVILLQNAPVDIEAALTLKDEDDIVISDLLNEATFKIGEKISIGRFEIWTKSDDESFAYYVYRDGRIVSLIKLKGDVNQEVAKQIALHIVAKKPLFINKDEMPEEFINKEKEIIIKQMSNENKPPEILEKIMAGRFEKQLAEYVLVNQQLFSDDKKKVQDVLEQSHTQVLAMLRYEIGEGYESK